MLKSPYRYCIAALCLALVFISCKQNEKVAEDKPVDENKRIFLRMIDFVKASQTDSLKKYIFNSQDTGLLGHDIRAAKRIIEKSNPALIIADSFFLSDSTIIPNSTPLYGYHLNFYGLDRIYTGTIRITFHADFPAQANFHAHEEIDIQTPLEW